MRRAVDNTTTDHRERLCIIVHRSGETTTSYGGHQMPLSITRPSLHRTSTICIQ